MSKTKKIEILIDDKKKIKLSELLNVKSKKKLIDYLTRIELYMGEHDPKSYEAMNRIINPLSPGPNANIFAVVDANKKIGGLRSGFLISYGISQAYKE